MAKKKAWSWSALAMIAFGLCLIGSFLIPDNFFTDISNKLKNKTSGSDKSSKKKKGNVLSMDLNKTIERSAKAIKAKDFDRASKLATRIVKEHPDSWIGWLNLGIAKKLGEGVTGVEPSIVAFQNAIKLNPEMVEIHIYLASALACTKHIKSARAVAFKALSMSPNSVEALSTAVKVTNFSTVDGEEIDSGALPLLNKIISLLQLHEQSSDEEDEEDGDSSKSIHRLSPSQESTLRFALFKALHEKREYPSAAIQLMSANNVKQFINHHLLIMSGESVGSWGKESSSALLGELLSAFNETTPLAMTLGNIDHSDDNVGEVAEKSDRSIKSDIKSSISDRNEDQYCQTLLNGMESNETIHYARPLVLIGMPRSGATLLQQMLSSHENIMEGDEYNYFSASIQLGIDEVKTDLNQSRFSMSEQVNVLSHNQIALKSIHEKYLTLLQSDISFHLNELIQEKKHMKERKAEKEGGGLLSRFFSSNIKTESPTSTSDDNSDDSDSGELDSAYYVIDKQLANTWWAGALPPCSKIVLLRRDPMDLAFSNFKTNFPMGGYEYTNNQTELGWRIALTDKILDLWEKIIPKENLEVVHYHDLVHKPEITTRRILSFLGLSYNQSVASPELYGGVITSPSSVNLRFSIEEYLASIDSSSSSSSESSGQWEKYASTFEEFIYAYSDAKKWIKYVMDGEGVEEGKDATPQGWLERGAFFDQIMLKTSSINTQQDIDTQDDKEDKDVTTVKPEVGKEDHVQSKSDEL